MVWIAVITQTDPSAEYESSHTTKSRCPTPHMLAGGFNGVIYIEDVEGEAVEGEDVSEGTAPPSCYAGEDPEDQAPVPLGIARNATRRRTGGSAAFPPRTQPGTETSRTGTTTTTCGQHTPER